MIIMEYLVKEDEVKFLIKFFLDLNLYIRRLKLYLELV